MPIDFKIDPIKPGEFSQDSISKQIDLWFEKFLEKNPAIDKENILDNYLLNIQMHKEFLDAFTNSIQGDNALKASNTNLALTVFAQNTFAKKAKAELGFYFPQGIVLVYEGCLQQDEFGTPIAPPSPSQPEGIPATPPQPGRTQKLAKDLCDLFQDEALKAVIRRYKGKYGENVAEWGFTARAELCKEIYQDLLDPKILRPMQDALPTEDLNKKTVSPFIHYTTAIVKANFIVQTGLPLSRGFILGEQHAKDIEAIYGKYPVQVEQQLEEIVNFYNRMEQVQIPQSKQKYNTEKVTFGMLCDLSGFTRDFVNDQQDKLTNIFLTPVTKTIENMLGGPNADESAKARDIIRKYRESRINEAKLTEDLTKLLTGNKVAAEDISKVIDEIKLAKESGKEVASFVRGVAISENKRLTGYYIDPEALQSFQTVTKEAKAAVGRDKDANIVIDYAQLPVETKLEINKKFSDVLKQFEGSFDKDTSITQQKRDELKTEARQFIKDQQKEYTGISIENPEVGQVALAMAKASLKPGKDEKPVAVPSAHFQAIFDSLVALTPQQQQQFITKYNDDPNAINKMLPKSDNIAENAAKLYYLQNMVENFGMHKAVFDMLEHIEHIDGKPPKTIDSVFVGKFNNLYTQLTTGIKPTEIENFVAYYNDPKTNGNVLKMLPKSTDFADNTHKKLYVRHIVENPTEFKKIFDKNQSSFFKTTINEAFVKKINALNAFPEKTLPKPKKLPPLGRLAEKPSALTADGVVVTTANKTTVDPQALETFAVQPQRTAPVDIGATQLATAPKTVVCFDFDQTIVNGHLHSALGRLGISGMSQLKEDQSNYKDGLIVDGKYVDQALAMNPDYKPDAVIAAAMNPDNYGGLKGKEQLKNAFQKILEQGHEIVITSNSQYPDGIKTVLASQCGFTQEQLDKIVIVCGYPNGGPNDNPLGKNEPLAEVMRIKGITDPKNIMLVDDSDNNITAAKRIGIRTIPVLKTANDVAHLPLLLEEATKMREEAIAKAQLISMPTSPAELGVIPVTATPSAPVNPVVVPVTPVSTVIKGSGSPAPLITASVEPQVNTKYQYEENDLQALNKANPVAKAEWAEPESLKGLNRVITKLPAAEGEKILLELNLGGSHWVGVGIERLADNKLSVVYMDSLSPTAQMPDQTQFTTVLETLGAEKKDISFTTYAHCWAQGSNVACGVYAHENLKRWATGAGDELNPGETKLRQNHVLLLGSKFGAKQLAGVSTVKPVSLLGETELTDAERKEQKVIVDAIRVIADPKIQQKIVKSFADMKSDAPAYFKAIDDAFTQIQVNADYSNIDKQAAQKVHELIFIGQPKKPYLVDPATLQAVALTMTPPVRLEDIVLKTEHPLLTAVENADTNEVANLLKAVQPISEDVIKEALELAMAKNDSSPTEVKGLLVIKQALIAELPSEVVAAMTPTAPVTVGTKTPSSTVNTGFTSSNPPIDLTGITLVDITDTSVTPAKKANVAKPRSIDDGSGTASPRKKLTGRIAELGLDTPQPVTSPAKPVSPAAPIITDPLLLAVETYNLEEVKNQLQSAKPDMVEAAKILAQRKIAELNDAPIFRDQQAATRQKQMQLGKLKGITKALDRIGKPLTPEVEVSLSDFSIFDSPASTVSVAPSASPIKVAPTLSNPSVAPTTNPLTASTQQSTSLATGGSSATIRTPVSPSTPTSYTPPTISSGMPDTTGFDPSQSSYPSAMQSASPSRFQPSRVTHPWDIRDAETEANGGFKTARNVMIACFLLLLIGLMAGGIPLIALAGLAVSGGFMAKYDDDMQTEKRQIAKQRNIQYGISEEPVHDKAPVMQPQRMYDMPTPAPFSKDPTHHRDSVMSKRARQTSIDVGGGGPASAP